MDNKLSYDKLSGYGEDKELEMFCIRKFFGNDIDIEEVTSKDMQTKGVDYIVIQHSDPEKRQIYIDTKIHRWTSEVVIAEDYDERPNYKNYGWLNPNVEHMTTFVLWIIPFYKEAFLFSHRMMMGLRNTIEWKTRNSLVTWHKDGNTYNKVFRPAELPGRKISWNVFEYNRSLGHIEQSRDMTEYLI